MSFENTKQTIFTGTELDYEEIVDIPDGYEKAELKDFEDGTLITGRPEMASVSSFTFDDDGEEKTVNRFKLYIFQDADQLYVEINVNLKNDGDIHKNVRKGWDDNPSKGKIRNLHILQFHCEGRSGIR